MRPRIWVLTVAILGATLWIVDPPLLSQTSQPPGAADCNRPAAEPVIYVPLAGEPVFVEATRDGCFLFVRTLGGLSVFRREGGTIRPVGEPLTLEGGSPIVLTRDERILIARQHGQLLFFDVARLVAGDLKPELGTIHSPRFERPTVNLPGTLLVSPDDRYLIAVQHWTAWIAIVDLDHVRTHGPGPEAIVGGMPTAELPGTIRLSPDGQRIYLAQAGTNGIEDPHSACEPVNRIHQETAGTLSETFRPAPISVVDLSLLLSGSQALVSDVVTDCSSISMAVSPSGERLYVPAHGTQSLLAFDTQPLLDGPPRLVGRVPIGVGARDIALVDDGRTIVIAHGNVGASIRNAPARLTIIDAAQVEHGAVAVRGVVPTRSQAVSLTASADGRTLFAPNRFDRTLQVIDLSRVSLEPLPGGAGAR
jgi:hypothetical protein